MADVESYTLKSFFSPALVRRLARELTTAWPSFPERAFVRDATAGLDALELLDRGRHIASAMGRHLPVDYPEAVNVLLKSLGAEYTTDENVGGGMAPFFYLPHVTYVMTRGLDHFDLSMQAQYELTKRFSAEFSIRAYIANDPERAFAYLERWTTDANAHVRRLASEGTRFRLPWAMRVAWLDEHPERVVALLERLKDDPSSMVRRSVANNLNDIGKTYPRLLVEICERWSLERPADDRRAELISHALRSAVKRGDRGALKLLGFGGTPAVRVEDVRFTPARVLIGGRVVMDFVLRSRAKRTQALLVDVAVHFVKAGGRTSAKVFKLKKIQLGAGKTAALCAAFSLKVHTTRKPQPGRHAVEVLVNGRKFAAGTFLVRRGSQG